MQFNGEKYGYVVNLQGDVVGLIDNTGTEVVKYVYDAWGKILSTTGALASTLGTIQPFRYRGYVYDQETGLFYLRSRYYLYEYGRFINADSIVTKNLFFYCESNPICFIDANGTSGKIAYNRDKIFSYGELYYNSQDPYFPPRSYNHNCVRFASQCLYVGLEDPDKYYDQWHCYKKGTNNTVVDQTRSWRLTNPFFEFLLDSDLGRVSAIIDENTDLTRVLAVSNIQEGDFIFFTENPSGEEDFFHVAVVSWVLNYDIKYMANTEDCLISSLSDYFVYNPNVYVTIVSIDD